MAGKTREVLCFGGKAASVVLEGAVHPLVPRTAFWHIWYVDICELHALLAIHRCRLSNLHHAFESQRILYTRVEAAVSESDILTAGGLKCTAR